MALTINDRLRTGALDGACDEFNVGSGATGEFTLLAVGSPIATMLLASPTAFQASTIVGGNAVAAANAITKDSAPTPGTVDAFALTDKDLTDLLEGTVGLSGSGADLIVSDNVIPVGATEVSCTSLTLSLALA